MRKEWIALGILGLLFVGVLFNAHYVKRHIETVQQSVLASRDHLLAGDRQAAERDLTNALEDWLNEDLYVSIFIRHTEVDNTTDAFFDALGVLDKERQSEQSAVFQRLLTHLDNIAKMEQLRLGTVF